MASRLGDEKLHPEKEKDQVKTWRNPFVETMYEWGEPEQEMVDVTNKTKLSG